MSGRWGQNLKFSWMRFCSPCIYSIGKVMDLLFPFLKQEWALASAQSWSQFVFQKEVVSYLTVAGIDGRGGQRRVEINLVYTNLALNTLGVYSQWNCDKSFLTFWSLRKHVAYVFINSECRSCISEGKNALLKIIHQCSVKTLIYPPNEKFSKFLINICF